MALPQLNTVPSYTTKVPSTGQSITYRPYLVKEEKILMIAFETGDQKEALRAVVNTLEACITENVKTEQLTTFDVEYLFTQVRSKSVGEVSTILLPCSNCKTKNEIEVDLTSVEVDMPDKSNIIELTPQISVEMQYPSYKTVISLNLEDQGAQLGFDMLTKCISAICTEEERIDTRDVKSEEIQEFIEQMTTDQFQKVAEFMQDMPSLKKNVKFGCVKCGETNEHTLQGINDFLS